MYDLEHRQNGWWYRCRKCGAIAGGYRDEATASVLAECHIAGPHSR